MRLRQNLVSWERYCTSFVLVYKQCYNLQTSRINVICQSMEKIMNYILLSIRVIGRMCGGSMVLSSTTCKKSFHFDSWILRITTIRNIHSTVFHWDMILGSLIHWKVLGRTQCAGTGTNPPLQPRMGPSTHQHESSQQHTKWMR